MTHPVTPRGDDRSTARRNCDGGPPARRPRRAGGRKMETDARAHETTPVATGAGNGAAAGRRAAAPEQVPVGRSRRGELPTWWQTSRRNREHVMLIRAPMPAAEEVAATKPAEGLRAGAQVRNRLIPRTRTSITRPRERAMWSTTRLASLDAVHREIHRAAGRARAVAVLAESPTRSRRLAHEEGRDHPSVFVSNLDSAR